MSFIYGISFLPPSETSTLLVNYRKLDYNSHTYEIIAIIIIARIGSCWAVIRLRHYFYSLLLLRCFFVNHYLVLRHNNRRLRLILESVSIIMIFPLFFPISCFCRVLCVLVRCQMLGNKRGWKLILSYSGGQQLRNPPWQELLLQNLPHRWSFARVFNKHVSYQFFQVLRICWWNSGIRPSEDLEHQSFHRVGIKRVSQRDHFVENTAKRPNVWLLVIWLFLTDLGW